MDYVKMSGAGNTFVMLDGHELPTPVDLTALARSACSVEQPYGGADGLIAVYPWAAGDFEMRYYNRDGSTGMMCGNGGRCAVRYAVDRGMVRNEQSVQFLNAGIHYRGAITDRGVRIWFPDPREFRIGERIELLGSSRTCHYADVGTPHAVLFIDEALPERSARVADVDLERWGPPLRSHERYGADGANANFVEVVPGRSAILLRTFERGVEAETGACGTGAISSAIVASLVRGLTPPVDVTTTSGETLRVDFRAEDGRIEDVSLEGGADVVGYGDARVQGSEFLAR